MGQDSFEDIKVKVGKRTCICSFELDTEGSTKQSSGSCDRKCSGSISGLELVNERWIYTLAAAVRKGKVSLKSLLVTPLTTTTDLEQVTPIFSNITIPPRACEQSLACTVQHQAGLPNANRLRGFCGSKSLVGGNCNSTLCSEEGCTCCRECLDNSCSAKGKGWHCYNKKSWSNLPDPKRSCLFDRSCTSAKGSPFSDSSCGCCNPESTSTTSTSTTTTFTTGNPSCSATKQCSVAFSGSQGLSFRGFCRAESPSQSFQYLEHFGCKTSSEPGKPSLCDSESCTCCPECYDKSCSSKGKGWNCYNKKIASALPKGTTCVDDGSCRGVPRYPPVITSAKYPCVCCKPPTTCEEDGCSKEWDGMGGCINTNSTDWKETNANFNFSVPIVEGKCGPDPCCVCFKKKECADEGCGEHFGGKGVCLSAHDPEFSEMSSVLDFDQGGREDLCAGCCTCFKKK